MDCAHAREQLHRSLDGLPAGSALRDHLATCPDCRMLLTELRRTAGLLSTFHDLPTPPDLLTGVMATIRERSLPRATLSRWQHTVTAIASAAALVGALLITLAIPWPASITADLLDPTPDGAASLNVSGFAGDQDDMMTATMSSPSDLLAITEGLSALLDDTGTLLLGLCFLFVAGIGLLVSLLAPESQRSAPAAVSSRR